MENPDEFKANTIEGNRPAHELFLEVSRLLDNEIEGERCYTGKTDFATDLLFIQAYKAFCGVYLLAVRGYEQDAATILRRLLEIAAQILYLNVSDTVEDRECRAAQCLQYDPDLGGYWWGTGGFKGLFCKKLDHSETFKEDYRLLAQIAHGFVRRTLPAVEQEKIQICSARLFSPLVVFSCCYILVSVIVWNRHFKLYDESDLEELSSKITGLRDRLIEQSGTMFN